MSKAPGSPKGTASSKAQASAKPAATSASVDAKPDESASTGDRIAKVLSRAGVASRREAERMIAEGRVIVNGTKIDSPALNVTSRDRIIVDGKPLPQAEAPRLWLFNKPIGLVTSNSDEKGRRTIFDALPEDLPRVMTVGRLDINSEGLLLLTNDGGIKRRLELPSTGWLRRYRVRINGRPQDADFEPLRQGMAIDGERFQPMNVVLDRQQGANAWLTIGLREGKNREIRRALEDIGFSVNRLLRLSYGPFQLGTLKLGEVEEIKSRILRDQLGLDPADMQVEETPTSRPTRGKPGSRPGGKPGGKPGGRPGARTSERSTDRADGKPAGKFAGKFAGKSMGKPSGKPTGKSSGKFTGKPGERTSDKPEYGSKSRFAAKPAHGSRDERSEPRGDSRSAGRGPDRSPDRGGNSRRDGGGKPAPRGPGSKPRPIGKNPRR